MIYISLGSNLGHRLKYLENAVELVKSRYLKNAQCSIVLETAPILPKNAPAEWYKPFLNMIVAGESDLSPPVLLKGLKQIEQELGRPKVYERWTPRVIDLDILSWDDLFLDTPDLKIPHPELPNRPFFLHLLSLMGSTQFGYRQNGQVFQDCFLRSLSITPRLVGIVNITPDSFSDGGLYNTSEKAIAQALKLAEVGATVVEIGAQSTRPGASLNNPEEELAKLTPVLDGLMPWMENGAIDISVDTFHPSVIHHLLNNYPIAWINDVRGNLDDTTLKQIVERQCRFCIMHSLSIPASKDKILPHHEPPMNVLLDWAKWTQDRLLSLGFAPDSIILDPGIGFGKNPYQSIEVLRCFEALKNLGSPILIGHARKSFMSSFSKEQAKNRDIETLAVSEILAEKADYLRVHNVAEHMRFFVARSLFKN